MGRLAAMLLVCVMTGLVPAVAQIPDLEALERELERLKAEEAARRPTLDSERAFEYSVSSDESRVYLELELMPHVYMYRHSFSV